MNTRRFNIPIVEDNPGDARLVQEALLAGQVPKSVNTVSSGDEALNYLYRRGAYGSAARPDLILLDRTRAHPARAARDEVARQRPRWRGRSAGHEASHCNRR
jgi:CheY-like chemotaxis protein